MQRMHSAAMPSITVRNVPVPVRDELAARAARAGRSLQEHLRAELIAMASKPTVEEVLARAHARKQGASGALSTRDILADRDADRR
ncbi:MAG: FitA-like ribbon-helix-helix domain-containing protein [Candidatus Limnocylindria bacterium]